MKRLLRFLIRGLLFAALLVGIDQGLLHAPPDIPGIRVVRDFYVDFRSRLANMVGGDDSATIEAAIETAQTPEDQPTRPKPPRNAPAQPATSPRYIYADENGQLQFAESLEDVPPAYRQSAELLEE